MSLILLLETATEVCSVGLCRENGQMLSLLESQEAFDHTAQVTLLIDRCLKEAACTMNDLDAVAVSQGPGSYTALRVGASVAKGIGYALDKPLIAVSTLQALARASVQATDDHQAVYCPMIDARRMEVYTAVYDREGRELMAPQALILDADAFDEFFSSRPALIFSGNGTSKSRDVLQKAEAVFRESSCSAEFLAPLACLAFVEKRFEDLAYFTPFYLKPPNITVPRKIL